MWYRYRRGPRGMRYFWFLFIPLFFIGGGHGLFGIFFWIATVVILSLIGRAIFAALASGSMTRNTWYQPPYQQPYQQPYTPNSYQQPYQSYQQGYQQPYYQPRPTEDRQANQQDQTQQQYDAYEQPRAEYPQEMPPMEQ